MSVAKDFLKELLALHPELHDFYDSKQHRLSEKIIEIMVTKCMTEEEMADLLEMDLDYLYRLTSGDDTIAVSEYELIIGQLQVI